MIMNLSQLLLDTKSRRLVGLLLLLGSVLFIMVPSADAEMSETTAVSGSTVIKLNDPLVTGGDIGTQRISPDNSTVVFIADAEIDVVNELYSVPIGGGTVTPLTEPFAADSGVGSFEIRPDSSMVVYEADPDTAGMTELFIVPIGGGTATKLNDVLVSGGDVNNFRISPDSSTVIYEADQETDEVDELFSVSLEIALNLAPVAADDTYSTAPDTALTVPAPGVLGNDTDGDNDGLTAVLVSNPGNGTLNLNADGSFTYTPDAGFTGSDSFTYQANDGKEDSNVATVTMTVREFTVYLPLIVK